MQEMYTINHVALMSGLSSRTIRNYMKMGFIHNKMSGPQKRANAFPMAVDVL